MKRDEKLMTILLSPVISEKSTEVADKKRTAVFRVMPAATKSDIRAAVETLFSVKVAHVRVANMLGKPIVVRGRPGRRAAWKKAYVRLQEGHDINFAELR